MKSFDLNKNNYKEILSQRLSLIIPFSTEPETLLEKNLFYSERKSSKPNRLYNELFSVTSSNNNVPIDISNLDLDFPNFVKSKSSVKPQNVIRAYTANTNFGTVR